MLLFIVYFLLSLFFTATQFVWISGVTKRHSAISSVHMLAASHVIAAVLLLGFAWEELPLLRQSTPLLLNVIGLSLCMLVARLLYYYAFSKADVGEVSIFSSLTPAYTLMIAPLFDYTLSMVEITGVLLISLSVYAFFLTKRASGRWWKVDWLSPFRKIFTSRPLFYTFLSTFPPALATIFQKQALEEASPYLIAFCLSFMIGLGGIVTEMLLFNREPRQSAGVSIWIKALPYTFTAGLLQAGAIVSISYFLIQTHPAVMQALLRFAIPLQIILAWVFLGEKERLGHRLLLSLGAGVGGYLILAEKF